MPSLTCPRCSARLPGDANYCRRCGELLRAGAPKLSYRSAPSPGRPEGPTKAQGGGGGALWWIMVSVGFFGIRTCNTPQRYAPPPAPTVIPVPQMPSFTPGPARVWTAPVAPVMPVPPNPRVPVPPPWPGGPSYPAPQPSGHR